MTTAPTTIPATTAGERLDELELELPPLEFELVFLSGLLLDMSRPLEALGDSVPVILEGVGGRLVVVGEALVVCGREVAVVVP